MAQRTPVFLLDANIVMYALGGPHLYREPCRKALAAVQANAIDVVTNVEVLQEILHRYRAVADPVLAERAYARVRDLCEVILPVRLRDMDLAVTLLKQFPSLRTRDAIHAATMLHAGIRRVDPAKLPKVSQPS